MKYLITLITVPAVFLGCIRTEPKSAIIEKGAATAIIEKDAIKTAINPEIGTRKDEKKTVIHNSGGGTVRVSDNDWRVIGAGCVGGFLVGLHIRAPRWSTRVFAYLKKKRAIKRNTHDK